MVRYLLGKIKHLVITLRLSLVTIFSLLFIGTMITLVSLFYLHLSEIVERAAFLVMNNTSHAVLHELNLHILPLKSISQFTANNVRDGVIDTKDQKKLSAYLAQVLLALPLAQGAHWSDMQGDFVYARRGEKGEIITEFIDRQGKPASAVQIYQDAHHNILKRVSIPINYDPRLAGWFQAAISKKRTIWTEAVASKRKPVFLGVIVATPVFDEKGMPVGVFGMDIRLDVISNELLANEKSNEKIGAHSEIFILDSAGKVLASPRFARTEASGTNVDVLPDVHAMGKPWLSTAYDIYRHTSQTTFSFKSDHAIYLASFEVIPIVSDHTWINGIVMPASDITKRIHHIELTSVLVVIAIFLIGLTLILNLVTRVVTPIKKLIRETIKIKNFELDHSKSVPSQIKEVRELSEAMSGMKMGLRLFQKYVPAGLVRQLIKTGEGIRIGGEKREVAIFFSDIKDFTSITEIADSNQLGKQMDAYFEFFSQGISRYHGTIDKYIGDSVMAFWGAPMPVLEPCQQAAQAALHCMQYVNQLNKKWLEEGQFLFVTRIGIHYGDVIVGNFGSSERLNYTVIGDAVNITSRLENANKLYGTSILVSEAVYQQIKDFFILRKVDEVVLKGKISSTVIYELLGETKQRILFDVDAYRPTFSQAFSAYRGCQWHEAIRHFDECLRIYPQDSLAPLFIARCKWFLLHPPVPEWNGVWHLSEK